MKRILCIGIVLFLFAVSLPGEEKACLKVAAIQFSIHEQDFSSIEVFRERITGLVERCMIFNPDIIVFPEYTSAFIALIPYYQAVKQSKTILEGFNRIMALEPMVRDLREFFLLNSSIVKRAVEDIFGRLAGRHMVYIAGGTYFAWEKSSGGEVELKNRAFIFGPEGRILYTQDKVFLTPFEIEVLGLSPGEISRVTPVPVKDYLVGLTICRDTYFRDWEVIFSECDLWLDIKANGTSYTPKEQESFLRALPARIRSGDVPYGITTCLTGKFKDLFWEGESSLVRKNDGDIQFLYRAETPAKEQILYFSIY